MEAALAAWVPTTVLAGIVIGGGAWIFRRLERLIDTIKDDITKLKTEMQARVSVADHRESINGIHEKINKTREEMIELKTELKLRRGAK